jgi:hypothetical protein
VWLIGDSSECGQVRRERSRVSSKILMRRELGGVDEDGENSQVVVRQGLANWRDLDACLCRVAETLTER